METIGFIEGDPSAIGLATNADPVEVALSYPFGWPQSDHVLVGDRLMKLVRFEPDEPLASIATNEQGGEIGWVADHVRRAGGTIGRTAGFQTIIASGSNGSPARIWAKLKHLPDRPPVFFVPGWLDGHVAAYSCHFSSYGSMPSSLTARPGARAKLIALVVPTMTLDVLHVSEALGRNYGYCRLGKGVFKADNGHELVRPHSYLTLRGLFSPDGSPRRMATAPVEGCDWLALDQHEALSGAAAMLGDRRSTKAFIKGLITDAKERDRRMIQLSNLACQDADATGWTRIA